MHFCPFAQRAHLVLDAKNIPHHIVNINLTQKPEWLTNYSPMGKVPALGLTNEPGKPFIYESLIIADYLDEKYRQQRLLHPTDSLNKAQDRLWLERFDDIIKAYYKIGFVAAAADDKAAPWKALFTGLSDFDAELRRRGTRFFSGTSQQPGMLDYMIWPWLERLSALPLLFPSGMPEGAGFELSRLQTLVQYIADMEQDDTVQKRLVPADIHAQYILGRLNGSPNYELTSSL